MIKIDIYSHLAFFLFNSFFLLKYSFLIFILAPVEPASSNNFSFKRKRMSSTVSKFDLINRKLKMKKMQSKEAANEYEDDIVDFDDDTATSRNQSMNSDLEEARKSENGSSMNRLDSHSEDVEYENSYTNYDYINDDGTELEEEDNGDDGYNDLYETDEDDGNENDEADDEQSDWPSNEATSVPGSLKSKLSEPDYKVIAWWDEASNMNEACMLGGGGPRKSKKKSHYEKLNLNYQKKLSNKNVNEIDDEEEKEFKSILTGTLDLLSNESKAKINSLLVRFFL